jgi:hypothetical protein
MIARIVKFPIRPPFYVEVMPDDGGWLVRVRSHGWLHSNRASALHDAQWLARNHGLPVRERVFSTTSTT